MKQITILSVKDGARGRAAAVRQIDFRSSPCAWHAARDVPVNLT
jgi:hypothetical protein